MSDIKLYMNTWANYNENGAVLSKYGIDNIADGWMDLDQALEFAQEHEEDEPFINDTDNVPFSISEYANVEDTIENLKHFENLSDTEKEVVEAYLEVESDDLEEALDVVERGDYYYLKGVDNDYDLGYEMVQNIGGVRAAVGDNVVNYIDSDLVRDSWKWDVDEIMREPAEDYVRDNFPELDEDSDEFDKEVENYIDSNREEYLDNLVDDELAQAENGDMSDDWYDRYFDYEAFGRDLSYDGWSFAKNGAVQFY